MNYNSIFTIDHTTFPKKHYQHRAGTTRVPPNSNNRHLPNTNLARLPAFTVIYIARIVMPIFFITGTIPAVACQLPHDYRR